MRIDWAVSGPTPTLESSHAWPFAKVYGHGENPDKVTRPYD